MARPAEWARADEEPLLFAQLLRWWTLVRRRPVVPLALATVAAIAMGLHRNRLPPIYEAEGMVQMGMNAGMSMDPGEYVLWVAGRERIMRTQEHLLTSGPVVESALRSLEREVPAGAGRRNALREFLAGVQVTPLEETYLVRVVAKNPDPEEAALRVNALMDAFLPFTNQFMVSRYALMERQLEDEMERLRGRLEEAERQMQDFYADSGSIQFDQRRETLHQRQRELDRRLTGMRIERASLEAEREMLGRGLKGPLGEESLEMLLSGLTGGSLQPRLEPLAKLRAQLVRLETELKPDHPEVMLLEQQVRSHERALREVAAAALGNLRMREEVAVKEEEKLAAMLGELEQEIVRLDHLDGLYRTRKRDVERFDRELEVLLQRHLRAESRSNMDAGTTLVLSRAETPEHPLPRGVASYVVLAFFLALGVGVALVVAYDHVEDTFSTEEEVRQLGLAVLGRIPQLDGAESERVVLQDSSARASEAFRDVRTYLAAGTLGERSAVLVTSGGPGVGKTFVSLNLGAAVARAGARTLLVDGDMRRPRLQIALGTAHERGLSDVLEGRAEMEEVVQPTELEGLWLLPSGPRPPNSSDLLATERFGVLIQAALEAYDQVVIDTPPVDVVSDASLMARHVRGCVLVVRLHRSHQRATQRAMEQVEAVGGTCLGAVINGVTRLDEGYGYRGYGYGRYAYSYGPNGDARPGGRVS